MSGGRMQLMLCLYRMCLPEINRTVGGAPMTHLAPPVGHLVLLNGREALHLPGERVGVRRGADRLARDLHTVSHACSGQRGASLTVSEPKRRPDTPPMEITPEFGPRDLLPRRST